MIKASIISLIVNMQDSFLKMSNYLGNENPNGLQNWILDVVFHYQTAFASVFCPFSTKPVYETHLHKQILKFDISTTGTHVTFEHKSLFTAMLIRTRCYSKFEDSRCSIHRLLWLEILCLSKMKFVPSCIISAG